MEGLLWYVEPGPEGAAEDLLVGLHNGRRARIGFRRGSERQLGWAVRRMHRLFVQMYSGRVRIPKA